MHIYPSKSASIRAGAKKYIYRSSEKVRVIRKTLIKEYIYASKRKIDLNEIPKSTYIPKYIYPSKPLYALCLC